MKSPVKLNDLEEFSQSSNSGEDISNSSAAVSAIVLIIIIVVIIFGAGTLSAAVGGLTTKITGGKVEKIIKKVLKRKYNIQRIDGLEESKVTPPESVYKRIKDENNKIGEARAINSDLPFFKEQFIMPVKGIISGVYGSQRILNGKPKWPHYGIDIAAKQGTLIKSSGSGVVTMAEEDLYYTGGTIIMDHGHGISTIYSHLETVLVSVGDQINQGDMIGTVGSTGRSTGPHLDFRVNWFQTRLDPMSVLQ